MELTETQEHQREWLVGVILSAKTLMKIDAARQELMHWLQQHSDDMGLTDGFDHLAMSRLLAQEREAVQSQTA